MEMKLKQSPSIDQDPQQKQLELQQRQLAMQQFLDQADLSKVEGQIDNKMGNTLDTHSPDEQKTLKKALAREAVKIDGENAKIGGIGVNSKTGKIIAQVGEFRYAIIDPKATLEAAKNAIDPSKLANQEASKTLDPERERSPVLDKSPERDSSKVLAQIDAKIEHKLDAYSPEDQQILKQALAEKMVRLGGENAPISDVGVADDGRFAATNERHTAVIEPRAVLEKAHAEQAALAREQAAQTLEKENPELAAQKNFSDDRYRYYMSEIQAQMNVLNAERNGPSFWTDAPLERQKEVNDQVSGLNLMRFALHDAADLSIPDQAKYFAKLDSEPFPTTAEEMRIDIIHDPIPEPLKTEPVQTEPVGTNGEQNSSETLIVMPQLTPEESEVSPSQLANLNENLAAINKEGDEIHAKNADVRAASEAQELININNALTADQTISDKYIEFEKNISDQLKVDPNDDSATATAKRFIAAQLALTRGAALFVGETVTSVADLATETGKYVGQSYLAIADALVGEALSRQYPFVQSAVQDKIQTDAKIDAALSNGATAVYNFVSDAGLHMLDTAFFHTLSESSQTFRDANANLYARETKVVNWATNYFSNTGNAYASANFVDLSKNAKDVIDIATSVTGIGAINKVNKVKKAAEAAHKLSDDLVDLEKLNQSNNINKLDDARDLTKTVDDASTHTKLLLEKSTATPEDLYKYLKSTDDYLASKGIESDLAKTYQETGKWPDNIQIPKSSDVLTPDGKIDWAQAPKDGYTLDLNGDAIKEAFTPKIGEIIDRYGSPSGRYTSPIKDDIPYNYDQRSLPFVEDPKMYKQYEIIGDFTKLEGVISKLSDAKLKNSIIAYVDRYHNGSYTNILPKKGVAAEAFGKGNGGAIQYELPLSVEWLEKMGVLKEIN